MNKANNHSFGILSFLQFFLVLTIVFIFVRHKVYAVKVIAFYIEQSLEPSVESLFMGFAIQM
jgi:hypothetical protein